MICLRCGHCCKAFMVPIVDDPEKGVAKDNIMMHKGEGEPCKHLRGDKPGEYSCAIHDKEWYNGTPCFFYGQVEHGNQECRIGRYMLNILELGKCQVD